MKTSVELNKEKLEQAKQLGKISTIKEVLDEALDAYIEKMRRHAMAELLGKGFFEGDLSKMRKSRGLPRR